MAETTLKQTAEASETMEALNVEQISWDQVDPEEKLRVLTQLTVNGQPGDYIDIVAGIEDVGIPVEQLLSIAAGLPAKTQKQIALKTKSKVIAEALIIAIKSQETLVDLTLYAQSVHARKNAALAINDKETLQQLQKQIGGRDKTVSKILDERLGSSSKAKADPTKATKTADSKLKTEPVKKLPKKEAKKEQKTGAKKEQKTESKEEPKKETEKNPAPAPKKKEATATTANAKAKSSPPKKALNPETEIPKLETELEKLSYKNTARLINLKSTLNDLQKQPAEASSDITTRMLAVLESLTEKIEKNNSHQEALKQSTDALLENLQKALDAGQSHDALPTWDKIQGNISNTSGKLRATLQEQANQYKTKLNELRDWKVFAATDKKKTLIQQMQHLLESKMHASDKSKHISNMHKQWKTLGRSNQNEELWREFKKLSDEAYEPCKAYFKQRKQVMADNLKARREICTKLEADIAEVEEDNINISLLNKLLQSSEQDWKKYAPVEQSKIKTLQKRFYGVVNQLRRLRKNALRDNGRQKQSFIAEAVKLAELEDKPKAMNEAKRLQQEWKKLGPTSYKEDKKYWEDFRAACDKIFAKRNEEQAEARASIDKAEAELVDILAALTKIIQLDDDAFRSSRGDFSDLQQSFASTLDPRIRKQRKKLVDDFNKLKSKIDTRFKTLPDKKQQALKNAVLEKATFLQTLEHELFASNDSGQFDALKAKLENGAWSELSSSNNANLEKALQNRADSLRKTGSIEELKQLAKDCEQQVRSLCIELEIRANIDTPEEDQSLRMQIQLDQLKQGFGQAKPDRKENARYAMDTELQAHCIGPVEKQTQASLITRLEQAVKKLL
jgi:DNA repair protein SbcC/Rad50